MITEAPGPDPLCVDHALDAHFRQLTEAGNLAFEQHDDATASRLYSEALTEAERLFELAMTAGGPPILLAPMVHNIACHNAVETRKQMGDDAGARRLKLRTLERLVTTAEAAASPLALRVNCVRHLKYALAFLVENLTELESNKDATERLVARASSVAAKVTHIAGLALASGDPPAQSDAGPCRRVLS